MCYNTFSKYDIKGKRCRLGWSSEKNEILKRALGISFEDVENTIMNDQVIDIITHHNHEKYAHQELMIVLIQNYTYYMPFVMTEDGIFLKNIISSRKYHK